MFEDITTKDFLKMGEEDIKTKIQIGKIKQDKICVCVCVCVRLHVHAHTTVAFHGHTADQIKTFKSSQRKRYFTYKKIKTRIVAPSAYHH